MTFSKYQFLIFQKNESEKCYFFPVNTLHAIGLYQNSDKKAHSLFFKLKSILYKIIKAKNRLNLE